MPGSAVAPGPTRRRGLRRLRVVRWLNRGLRPLRASMGRRGVGYICALTCGVTLFGAAGILAFEKSPGGPGLKD